MRKTDYANTSFTTVPPTSVRRKSRAVAPASPWENGFVESFHSRLRDEFLDRVLLENVADAKACPLLAAHPATHCKDAGEA